MRKITFLFSVILHLALIYWLFNARFQLTIVKMGEEITAVSLISIEKKGTAAPKQETTAAQKLIFTEPSVGGRGFPRGSRAARKDIKAKNKNTPPHFKFKANFSFSHGRKQPSILKHKPDFLLTPGRTKDFYFVDPPGKIEPEPRDFFKYLYPHRYSYSDLDKLFPPGDTSSSGSGGGSGGDYSPRQKGVGMDIDAGGFNIRPWAKKALIKVQGNWQIPSDLRLAPKTSISVGVLVTIEKSGMTSATEIKKKSKEKSLDQSALMALNSCVPFPELPQGFPLKNLEAYFLFNVKNE